MSGAVFHRIDRDLIVQRLRGYAERELAPRSEVREVVLIGSLARGDWSARSDADIVILVDHATEPGPFRGTAYAPAASVGVAVDVFVYTPEEAANWSPRFKTEVERSLLLYRRDSSVNAAAPSPRPSPSQRERDPFRSPRPEGGEGWGEG
jgi:predicted nucleotidyltransferase